MLTLSFRSDDVSVQSESLGSVAAALDQFRAMADRLDVVNGDMRAQFASSHDRIRDIEERLQLAENRPVAPVNTRM